MGFKQVCILHSRYTAPHFTAIFLQIPKNPFFTICGVLFGISLDRFFAIRNNISPAKCLSCNLLTVAFLRLMAPMDVEDYVRSLTLLGDGKNFLYTSLK